MKYLFSLGLVSALLFFSPSSAEAQCNACGNVCEGHWDNCGTWGPGDLWDGGCMSQSCRAGTCEEVHAPFGCDPDVSSVSLDELEKLVREESFDLIADAAITGKLQFDAHRNVLFVKSCGGEMLIAQIPLPKEYGVRIAATVDTRRMALLADLDRQ